MFTASSSSCCKSVDALYATENLSERCHMQRLPMQLTKIVDMSDQFDVLDFLFQGGFEIILTAL